MKSSNVFIGFGIIALVIVLGQYASVFSLLGEQVWIPQYLSAECVPRAENLNSRQITSHTDAPTVYQCTTASSGTWIPQRTECEYTISNYGTATVYTCDGLLNELDKSRCSRQRGIWEEFVTSNQINTFSVDAGDSIYINTNAGFLGIGEARLDVKYPAYGLQVETADGRVLSTTTTCELTSLSREYHTIDADELKIVQPDSPFNAVTGQFPARTSQAVRLSDVANGEPIYISRPNYYYPIKEADDGFLYVDTSVSEKFDSDIQCIPRTTGCSDNAKVINIEDQSCDETSGSIGGYAPVEGDESRLCKYGCVNGKIQQTNDCITVQSCTSDKPLWNPETGQCVNVLPPEEGNIFSNTVILIILGGIVLILIGFVIRMRRTK